MEKVKKPEADWRRQLSPTEYSVTREKATERPFTGRYWDHHEEGIYRWYAEHAHERGEPIQDLFGPKLTLRSWPLQQPVVVRHVLSVPPAQRPRTATALPLLVVNWLRGLDPTPAFRTPRKLLFQILLRAVGVERRVIELSEHEGVCQRPTTGPLSWRRPRR